MLLIWTGSVVIRPGPVTNSPYLPRKTPWAAAPSGRFTAEFRALPEYCWPVQGLHVTSWRGAGIRDPGARASRVYRRRSGGEIDVGGDARQKGARHHVEL